MPKSMRYSVLVTKSAEKSKGERRRPVKFEDVVKRLLNTPPPPKDWKPNAKVQSGRGGRNGAAHKIIKINKL